MYRFGHTRCLIFHHFSAADAQFKMGVQVLWRWVDEDRAADYQPFCVVVMTGTVAMGAVDPLYSLSDFCAEQGLWFHIKETMGVFSVLDPQKAHLIAGMDRADTFAMDPHKRLGIVIDCICAVVKNGQLLFDTFNLVLPYIHLKQEEERSFDELPGFAEYLFQQMQRSLALKLD